MEANLNSKVSNTFTVRDPLEPFVSAPFPCSYLLAGQDGNKFVPVDFYPGCAAKGFEDLLCPVHVRRGTL